MSDLITKLLAAVLKPVKAVLRGGAERFLESKAQKKLKKHTRKLAGKLIRFGLLLSCLGLLIGNLDRILAFFVAKKN